MATTRKAAPAPAARTRKATVPAEKATPARSTATATPAAPSKAAAPSRAAAPSKAAPAKPNGNGDRLDLAALASGATVAKELPKVSRGGGGGRTGGAMAPLVQRSLDDGIALSLPPVADDHAVTTLRNALRRAAMAIGCGLSVRPEQTAAGFIVHFQAKAKKAG